MAGTGISKMTTEDPTRLPHMEGLSRRRFLMGASLALLTGCGGGGERLDATGAAGATATFVHPGLLHTQADFERMRAKVASSSSPWIESWRLLIANSHASLSRTPNPQSAIYRGKDGIHNENYDILYNDIAAAYACALRWKISGERAYADKAAQYLDAWSSTLTTLGGNSDVNLAAGLYGYQFANVAEIMRTDGEWSAASLTRFQSLMRNVFIPVNIDFLNRHNKAEITHYWANWDLCNIASLLAIGVLCDDQELFSKGITYFQSGAGNGCIEQAVYFVHPGYLGQWQETGRDQGHNTLGIALGGAICEMAWNQGVDLYGLDNNRFLAGAEYVAKANLIQSGDTYYSVPYVTYQNVDVTQKTLSTTNQGTVRPCWALVANHYVNRLGLAAPYSKLFADRTAPEGGGGNYGPNSGGYDQLGYGTLTCTLDQGTAAPAPSGLCGHASGSAIVLSWWGCSNAVSYSVKRAGVDGNFITIESGISDLLSYTDIPPAPGPYAYAVSAQTATGESALSDPVQVSTAVRLHTSLSFDEGVGRRASDSSGQGHHGILVDGATWGPGRIGTAVSLDGSGAHVALPANLLSDVSDFTIAAWVYWNAIQTDTSIFDFGSSPYRYLMLTPCSADGAVRFIMTVNGYGDQIIDGTTVLPTGRWIHLAITLSGSTGTLYVNGQLAGSNDRLFLAPFRLGKTQNNSLGKSQSASNSTFNGLIDDFRIYEGALDAAQILSLTSVQV